ncbi:ABC transporter ATP-binding protein [Asanoa sp. WMMD1127]|uniref:ABC transporter ATP-binding protein n=1 Tax=Asanoa sp. WMMD1127 TaxID=3016107 RepID=UPI002416A125|nr:ABC transporter ATP-binding protein [Asanoa sp. WMMD1127]MDG4826090.1 ABC transporter ATP-binding protein [Asanoa sp. WMMD1127]
MHIEIADLRRRFGRVTALDGVDLTVSSGMFGLLGTNGAGKTTLMRILAGVLSATSGRVVVGGHDLSTRAGRVAVQRRLGYLPQDLGLYPDLTPTEFLDYIGLLKGLDDRTARRRQVGELLDLVGLSDVAGRKLKGFSGGMRRRVGIAQALLGDPTLLIVDEPTVGLDPEERIRFRTLLSTLAGNRTVLLSTHIVEDVAQTCRHTAVLAAGRVLFNGAVTDLTARAEGLTWEIVTPGPPPTDGVVVSAIARADGTHYRVVSRQAPAPDALPVSPSLEEGYVALMRSATPTPVG